MTENEKPLKCSICGEDIPAMGTWRDGNNAEPVNNGRCCDDCNWKVVIPTRLGIKFIDLAILPQEE